MDISDLGATPWVILTALGTWAGAAWRYSDVRQERKEARQERKDAKALELEAHRDEMLFTLLQAVKAENERALTELAEVREENRALLALEKHFYHFKQALEHLEAILFAPDTAARDAAERAAKAFLDRMKRVEQAKGDIQQAIQVVESAERIEERERDNES